MLILTPQRYLARMIYFLSKQDWECTSFPEGNWVDCCRKHDYDCADAQARRSAKLWHQGNLDLKKCVSKKGHPCIASLMFEGVEFEMERRIAAGDIDDDR